MYFIFDSGKQGNKKDLGMMAMSYENVFVATVSLADMKQMTQAAPAPLKQESYQQLPPPPVPPAPPANPAPSMLPGAQQQQQGRTQRGFANNTSERGGVLQ